MMWLALIIGLPLILFWAASQSRHRKQRIVEARWRQALPASLLRHAGALQIDLGDDEAKRQSALIFDDIFAAYGVANFPDLMRKMVTTDAAQSYDITREICRKAAHRLPIPDAVHPSVSAQIIQTAIEQAGSEAQAAADRSGEV